MINDEFNEQLLRATEKIAEIIEDSAFGSSSPHTDYYNTILIIHPGNGLPYSSKRSTEVFSTTMSLKDAWNIDERTTHKNRMVTLRITSANDILAPIHMTLRVRQPENHLPVIEARIIHPEELAGETYTSLELVGENTALAKEMINAMLAQLQAAIRSGSVRHKKDPLSMNGPS
tara:strand:+ start:251 stop:772 length:522 start_codon:yes stop_codon:yes gene_type:complete